MDARLLFLPGGALARHLPGYRPRDGQLAMVEAVVGAVADDRPVLVEAGTGTGKSLAYLLPALLTGRKVVVATATIALQEQLLKKDVPLVEAILAEHGRTLTVAIVKGLQNFLCLRRFEEARIDARLDGSPPPGFAEIEAWARTTETGDRSELTELGDDAAAWHAVQSSTETRLGNACPHHERCFITKMRKNADEAQLVIVNHHLLMADLALRTASIREYASVLPSYDVLIVDEAHQLEDVATTFFGTTLSSGKVDQLLGDLRRHLTRRSLLNKREGTERITRLAHATEGMARTFFSAVAELLTRDSSGNAQSRSLAVADWTGPLEGAREALVETLFALEGALHEAANDEALAVAERRAGDVRRALDAVGQALGAHWEADDEVPPSSDDPDALPNTKVVGASMRGRSVTMTVAPVQVGTELSKRLFPRVGPIVFTSATLSTALANGRRDFKFVRQRLGLPPHAHELRVPSPFDVHRSALLYLPDDLPEPASAAFDRAAAERVRELIALTGGGAFVLCTSHRALRVFEAALRPSVGEHLLVQGEAPKHVLLQRFRDHGDAVLVATASFWEGVDVPGAALRLVVIDRIPFPVPTEPLHEARCRAIDKRGGNSFAEYTIPTAAIALQQGFGRLLRRETDTGIVAILDRRLTSKPYGKTLLASLPEARRMTSWEALAAAWEELGQRPS
jgi:ATP-dependent DNA helicase DinG